MKKHFLTGLVIIFPAAITLVIVNFLIKILTAPFLAATQYIIYSISTDQGFLYIMRNPFVLDFTSKVLVLLFIFAVIIAIGFLGQQFFLTTAFKYGDRLMHKIPLANKIYKSVQEVVHNIFVKSTPNFSQAVLLPFTFSGSTAIGFVTKDSLPISKLEGASDLVSVFVPGTPNPMLGFMVILPKSKLTPLDMPLEEAVKFVVSCGVLYKSNP